MRSTSPNSSTPPSHDARHAHAAGAVGARAWRCFGWVGALMLCVVLASAGVSAERGAIADHARIEACRDGGRALAHAAARRPHEARPEVAAAVAAPPRPRARARTIEDGGLPPPRAPTV